MSLVSFWVGIFLVCIRFQRWAVVHVGECGSVGNWRLHSLLLSSSRSKTKVTLVEFVRNHWPSSMI